jgi:UDP-2,4-diacetamido-2,4,6-trideoxy-beta-L-altropyranose hydrolase
MDVQSPATTAMIALAQPRIAFRTDASVEIGTGHVMRSLTLADALRERGARCTFICRPHRGHLLDMIAQRGHHAVALPNDGTATHHMPADPVHAAWLGTDWQTDAQQTREALGGESVDWLVVDHYALDHRWEQALRPHCQNLMVIDDLADRPHDCDLLLDQNLGRSAQDYDGLLKPQTATYIGPRYALLRPEFAQLRSQSLARRTQPQLKHLLITMGGVDKDNATGQVLKALTACHLPTDLRITVVMGPHSPCLADVQQQAAQMPWPTQVLVGVNAMAQLMADSDLCIGAAGATSWERCCLGVPTIICVLAANQREIAESLESAGAALAIDVQQLGAQTELSDLIVDKNKLHFLGKCASEVADGLGAERITAILFESRKYAYQHTV